MTTSRADLWLPYAVMHTQHMQNIGTENEEAREPSMAAISHLCHTGMATGKGQQRDGGEAPNTENTWKSLIHSFILPTAKMQTILEPQGILQVG